MAQQIFPCAPHYKALLSLRGLFNICKPHKEQSDERIATQLLMHEVTGAGTKNDAVKNRQLLGFYTYITIRLQ